MSHEPVFDANGWAPIESAPNFKGGGDAFQIYIPTAKVRKISLSRGGGSGERWFREKGYTIFDDRMNPVRATHWKPLGPGPVGT